MSNKVAIVGPSWPFRGGLADFNERLAREWAKRGDDVTIHTFTRQYPGMLFPGTSQFTDRPAPSDLAIRRSIHAYNPLQWRYASNEISAGNYDLALIRFWLPAMGLSLGHVARTLTHRTSTRVVALVDNLYPHESRPLDRWLTNRFVRHPHAFVTLSNIVASQLKAVAAERPVCTALHPLYDDYGSPIDQAEARAQIGIQSDGPLLLFFGFIRKYKGLDLLLRALGHDSVRRQGIKVVIAGEWYEDSAPYKALAQHLGVEDMLVWRDRFIPESEISTYFSAADAVVQPYRNATQSGISALAFAYSKPLISTRVGGLSELVEDGKNGFLCDPDPESIRDAIVQWANTADQQFMVEQIRYQRAKMTWAHLIDVIEGCR